MPRGAVSACGRFLLLLAFVAAAAAERRDAPLPRYNILALIPFGGSSHTFDHVAVAGRLAARGHNVTVAVPGGAVQHTLDAIRRLGGDAGPMHTEVVDALPSAKELLKIMGSVPAQSLVDMLKRFSRVPPVMAEMCRAIVTNATLMAEWRRFDAVLSVPFPIPAEDSCACLVAHAIDAPLMYVRDLFLTGGPINVPQMGSSQSRDQIRGTWSGYMKNALPWAIMTVTSKALGAIERRSFRPLRRQLNLPLGSEVSGLTCTPWVEVVSSNWLHEEPQPIAPPRVMVGAISPHPSHPTIGDPQIAAFAQQAEASGHGLVLVSFGSNSQTFGKYMNGSDYENLALAFADLAPVRVLWQLSPNALPAGTSPQDLPLGPNTLVVPWAPINDVLGHVACRAFVTHGGQKSTYEAMFHGVPVVGVPFMVEQATNMQRAAARGFGVVSQEAVGLRKEGQRFSRQGMATLIQKVLSPSSYASAAHQVGEAMRLEYSQRRPVDRAADEVELAMVHGGYAVGHSLSRAERHAAAQAAAADAKQASGSESGDSVAKSEL